LQPSTAMTASGVHREMSPRNAYKDAVGHARHTLWGSKEMCNCTSTPSRGRTLAALNCSLSTDAPCLLAGKECNVNNNNARNEHGGRTLVDLAIGASAQGRSQFQAVHHAGGALTQRLRQAQQISKALAFVGGW
jgi:hypothetical protein